MRYDVHVEQTFETPADAAWQVWTDFDRFPEWDPREEESKLDGPFAVGTTGTSKQRGYGRNVITLTGITDVADAAEAAEGRSWQATTPLPGGALVIEHTVTDLGDGRTRLAKTYTATGPVSVAFRLHYARRIRREVPPSLAALAAEARRVAEARGDSDAEARGEE